jgi:hypothetical protein
MYTITAPQKEYLIMAMQRSISILESRLINEQAAASIAKTPTGARHVSRSPPSAGILL